MGKDKDKKKHHHKHQKHGKNRENSKKEKYKVDEPIDDEIEANDADIDEKKHKSTEHVQIVEEEDKKKTFFSIFKLKKFDTSVRVAILICAISFIFLIIVSVSCAAVYSLTSETNRGFEQQCYFSRNCDASTFTECKGFKCVCPNGYKWFYEQEFCLDEFIARGLGVRVKN